MQLSISAIFSVLERHDRDIDFDIDFAEKYGEPGYSDPERGIFLANWNNVPKFISNWLENHGFEIEWSDEWIRSEGGKLYRCQPDSYSWTPSYIINDCTVIGKDEIQESKSEQDWYVNEYLLNDCDRADTFGINLEKHGFTPYGEDDCETGFHPGQDDSPENVSKRIQKELPDHDVVFAITERSQFYTKWRAYVRKCD